MHLFEISLVRFANSLFRFNVTNVPRRSLDTITLNMETVSLKTACHSKSIQPQSTNLCIMYVSHINR